jgi:hypothetical protein
MVSRTGDHVGEVSLVNEPFRRIIESINQIFKAQLGLERQGGRKPAGV